MAWEMFLVSKVRAILLAVWLLCICKENAIQFILCLKINFSKELHFKSPSLLVIIE